MTNFKLLHPMTRSWIHCLRFAWCSVHRQVSCKHCSCIEGPVYNEYICHTLVPVYIYAVHLSSQAER